MAVAYFEKSEIRDLLSIARGRGVRIPSPTVEQLDDPQYIQEMRRRLGRYPNDLEYAKAKSIAEQLGHTLTEAERMNRIACKRFIQDGRERLPVKPPTEAQIDLMYSLAEMKGVTPSEACEVEFAAWDEFMSTNITRDDEDRGYEALVRLQKGGIKLDNYGHKVGALALAKRFEEAEEKTLDERIDEMLLGKEDPYNVALDLEIPYERVHERACRLEGMGHELVWL